MNPTEMNKDQKSEQSGALAPPKNVIRIDEAGSVRQVSHILFFQIDAGLWGLVFVVLCYGVITAGFEKRKKAVGRLEFFKSGRPGREANRLVHAACITSSLACSFSRSMSRYRRAPQCVPAICL